MAEKRKAMVTRLHTAVDQIHNSPGQSPSVGLKKWVALSFAAISILKRYFFPTIIIE